MRFFKKLTVILLIALSIGVGWVAIYAYDKGFTKKWRRLVNKEFEKYGIEASIGRLTLDPFQGLVARDVFFYEDESKKSLLAAVSRITLDIDFIRLLEEEFFLNTIDIKNANLSLPVDPGSPNSGYLEVEDFNARVLMPGDRIEISQAHGRLQGIEVAARGTLFRPKSETVGRNGVEILSASAPSDDTTRLEITRERRQLLNRILEVTELFTFPKSNPPRINIELIGDLDDLQSLRGRVQFSAGDISHRGYTCSRVEGLIELAHARASLKKLHLQDKSGELVAQADHHLGSDLVNLTLQSSLDLHGLLGAIFPDLGLGEIVLYEAPRIQFEGAIHLSEFPVKGARLPVECMGSIRCGTFASRGEIFDGIEADFGINRDRYYFRNIRIAHRAGSLTANGIFDSNGLTYDSVIKMDPKVFIPFARSEGAQKFLSRIKVNEDSGIYLKLNGSGPSFDTKTWHSRGELDVHDIHYNGIPVRQVRTDLEWIQRQHYYRDVTLKLPEGTVTADSVSYRLDDGLAVISQARGTVFPVQLTRIFSEKTSRKLEPYRFKSAPFVALDGTIDPKGKIATDLHVKITANGETDYDFLDQTLTFDEGTAKLHFRKSDIAGAEIDGGLFGGRLATAFSVNDLPGDRNYSAKVDFKSLSFQKISSRYGYHSDTEGELTGYFNFTGNREGRRSIDGKGVGIIVNGDVFAIPVLGPLSKIVSGVTSQKNAGHSVAREASANFTMKDGIVSTTDFEALANAFQLRGAGTIDTNNDTIDFDIRMNARGAPGILLFPVSKLLEYRGEGSLRDPEWRPKIISGPKSR